jgi:hypothetical protein
MSATSVLENDILVLRRYLLPRMDVDYPLGLRNSGVSRNRLEDALSSRLVIMLGELDIDENDPALITANKDVALWLTQV